MFITFFISIINEKNKKESLRILKKSSGFIRSEVAKKLNMRYTPELVFEFDDSIEYIKPFVEEGEKKGLIYKRINKPERLTDYNYLSNVLSAGTMRGIYVFMASLIAFRIGGTILIDEFEKSFNKNLVQNLILLFNDVSINRANATLLYTTHYGELLDDNDRVDNINVLHRNKDSITITNLCTGYDFKVELLKSNYFNQNAFDNLLNYNNLMDLRRAIK